MALLPLLLVLVASVSGVPKELNLGELAGKKILFISAHPDDIEASAGGTVALLTEQGSEVFYMIVTNGDKGCDNPICENATSVEIAAMRELEAIQAALILGVPKANVILLDYEDAMVPTYPQVQIETQLIAHIRSIQPFAVFTWFPYPDFKLQPLSLWSDVGYHPDHQAVGRLALESVFNSGVGLMMPELGPAWSPSQFYMWAFNQDITHYSNINSTIQLKVESYLAHKTQYNDPKGMAEWIEWLSAQVAQNCGVSSDLQYAEAFTAYY
eukprot:TRINITY_DN1431_c0_g1_i1.p1 TRINITY_DN1431_c0_g1~~TRINITY_DN1431_c0_g1_i1.p1  ORF type:complete len:269 (-),score=32.56 TRINITY_DN1431_c0_g1_i1:298-1104(-)